MKIFITLLLLSLSSLGYSQCRLIEFISDTIEFEGVKVVYYQSDSIVKIKYSKNDFTCEFPIEYNITCENTYLPSVWTPRWRNSRYIGFTSGCGTYCFTNILAPLDSNDSFKEAGQILVDSINVIYFSLYNDTLDFSPYLKVKNYNTDKIQVFKLSSNDFWGAIPLERLDYSNPHPNGFIYKDQILTLFLRDKEQNLIKRTFKIEI